VRVGFLPCLKTMGDEMRRATIACMDNGLPVQCLSERDFLFPDADEKYVPDARAYIQSYDVPAFHALLRAGSPEDAVAAFPYLSDRVFRIVKKPSPSGGCSRTGRKNWREGGTACRHTSWHGWSGKGSTVTPGTIRPALSMRKNRARLERSTSGVRARSWCQPMCRQGT
jgi:hypothetical protein